MNLPDAPTLMVQGFHEHRTNFCCLDHGSFVIARSGSQIRHRGIMLVMVLASMEQTVTSTAMPTIIGELHGLEHYSWVASIYLLACTVSMPLYGRLADALGRKKRVIARLSCFAAHRCWRRRRARWCSLIFRGIQGLGAGGIMPVVLTILGDIFTLEERANSRVFQWRLGHGVPGRADAGGISGQYIWLAIDLFCESAVRIDRAGGAGVEISRR